ncbi:MAG: hypothetical protein BGO12_04460 [Verrucomicrobia bacterium 61-8]|nr:MAG: hypothetical protein BGO12_04460 [Verrucomicrobia bacterium 61-8]
MSLNPSTTTDEELKNLASQIRDAATTVEECERIGLEALKRSRVSAAINAGKLLLEAKARLPHGQWETWLRENVSELFQSTACRWMKLAEEPKLSELTDLENPKLTEIYESCGKGAENEPKAAKTGCRDSSADAVVTTAIKLQKRLRQFVQKSTGISEDARNQLDLIWTEIESNMATLLGRKK